jgi:DNA-binding transcriptional LysR family regulator
MIRQLRLRQPSDIARAPMIHVVSFPLAWPMWLRQAGVSAAKVKQAIWVDSFESALQLAENGAGVALGWRRCSPSVSASASSAVPSR